ncbi:hypothetical protein GQ607_007610 [Colletotrichum asianum]|uniref:Uncharacterized protein n=1 Tax=Colletotrichum asianum TaxID=702518 RepID=A0A8H3ZMY9_9PEZI|nr:hypothetical protein GQ607_007610 [Colletotrichum asianum]
MGALPQRNVQKTLFAAQTYFMKHFPTSMTWERAEKCLKSTATSHHIHAVGTLTPALTSSSSHSFESATGLTPWNELNAMSSSQNEA